MWRVLVAALVLSSFMPVSSLAASVETQEQPPVVAMDETDRLIHAYYTDFYAEKYERAFDDIKTLSPDAVNREGRALLAAMRAAALLGMKRDAEAQKLIGEVRQISPQQPAADSLLFDAGLVTKHFDVSANALDSLIARYPDAVRDLSNESVSFFLNHEPSGQDLRNEDRRIQLANIGFGGDLNGDYLAAGAVGILVNRGDWAGAKDLLRYIDEPQLVENMLIQKRYSPLWPGLVEIAGPHLSKIRESSLATADRAYLAAPDDNEKLQAYVDALRHAGRLNDAISLKAKLPGTREAMATADEMTGWVVNSVAYALFDAGRGEEGDQLFAMLNEPQRTDARWRVSMIINRLEMLVINGKFDKAATLLDAAEASARNDGNPYAQQLVRRLQYCTVSSLGKREEAARLLPDLMSHADDAMEATVGGLLCAGETDKAEQLVLKALKSPDKKKRERFEADFVRALQPNLLTDDDPSVWHGRWSELRKRPAIAAEFNRLGRDMPPELLAEKRAATAN